jgi:hypothetical protein
MDARVRDFVAKVARDVVGLDVALFFQANPATFDTSAGLALRLHRNLDEVQPALERLAEAGVLDIFTRGDGRYRCYSLSREPQVWHLLCLISEAYLDYPEVRKEIVRMLVRQHAEDRSRPHSTPTEE